MTSNGPSAVLSSDEITIVTREWKSRSLRDGLPLRPEWHRQGHREAGAAVPALGAGFLQGVRTNGARAD